jgi:1-aminocyclopropane-1-carboxylate deaminase
VLDYNETPIQELNSDFLEKAGIRVLIKREDLNHHDVSGNKWWKLKYNLAEATRKNHHTLLTFGGRYSNHICATAAAAKESGFKSIGIIRGEERTPLNATLISAEASGMKLHFISRENYRRKNDEAVEGYFEKEFGEFYLIPEGGTNALAVKGCEEFGQRLAAEKFDQLCLPIGTGGTMAGIVLGLKGKKIVTGFSVLKGGEFLKEEIEKLLGNCLPEGTTRWAIETSYHFGGYAKTTRKLSDFIASFHTDYNIPLEHVYTAKMMFGIFDQIAHNKYARGTTILAIHTGGIR